jgi:hypothetical protein
VSSDERTTPPVVADGPDERQRHRNAWTLLLVHALAFVVLLIGFIARVRYAEAEGVLLDPVLIVLAVVLTVVFVVALSVTLTFARRSRLRKAVAAARGTSGAGEVTVFGYWSRPNTAPLLADPGAMRGRGMEVAVTATTEGLRLRTLRERKLADFGLIPWSAVVAIDGARKLVGVGIAAKGGVITIRTDHPVAPYAQLIELFPAGESSAEAAARLRSADPRTSR